MNPYHQLELLDQFATLAARARAGVTLPHNATQQRRVTARGAGAISAPATSSSTTPTCTTSARTWATAGLVHASRTGAPVTMKRVGDGPVHSYGRPG